MRRVGNFYERNKYPKRMECDSGMWRFIFNLRTFQKVWVVECSDCCTTSKTSPLSAFPRAMPMSHKYLSCLPKDAQGQKSKYLSLKMNKLFCSLTEKAKFTILDNTSPPFITSLNGRKTNFTFALRTIYHSNLSFTIMSLRSNQIPPGNRHQPSLTHHRY